MKKKIASALLFPLICFSSHAYAQNDFTLNSVSASRIDNSGAHANIQQPQVFIPKNTNDAYDFPVKPGMEEWKAFTNPDEKVIACQIPESLLGKMSTAGLVETVINYPLYWDMLGSNSGLQQGFNAVAVRFNGLQELLKRKDAGAELLTRYSGMNPIGFRDSTDEEIGEHLFQCYSVEILFAQAAIRANLTEAQRQMLQKELLAKYELKKSIKEDGGLTKVIMALNGFSQEILGRASPISVYTPNHSEVPAWLMDMTDELTPRQIARCNSAIDNGYPNAHRETNCTRMYNCHSYAWHNQSTSNRVWINTPNQKTYWQDGSYSPWLGPVVASGMKLDYYADDHSAIFVSGQDPTSNPAMSTCRSKWGDMALVLHSCNDTPLIYNPNDGIHAYTLTPSTRTFSSR